MAEEERIDEAVATLEKDFDKLSTGAVTLLIFAIIALAISFFTRFDSTTINLILGLLIAGPMIYRGMKRLDRSIKLLDPGHQSQEKSLPHSAQNRLDQPHSDLDESPEVPDTDPMLLHPGSISVTEESTQLLKHNRG